LPNRNVHFGIWIDWDTDGLFDAFYKGDGLTSSPVDVEVNVAVPEDYVLGDPLFARVRASETSLDSSDVGAIINNGEIEDHLVFFDQALPVELIEFDGKKEENNSKLNWTTASEINTKSFEILHSEDGINFIPIGEVQATGSLSTVTNYEYIDVAPSKGINYYKLRIVDLDGSITYSNIISIVFDESFNSEKILVYPNPTFRVINLSGVDFNIGDQYQIYSSKGDIVMRGVITNDVDTNIDVGILAQGFYYIKLNSGDRTFRQSFVKN
ncbi:MAG: T9SS type A sorting domain-containing protein, partial [Bacteroidota bacterium]